MQRLPCRWLAVLALVIPACPVMAQATAPTTIPAPTPASQVAATVNGQPIAEALVQKMLRRVPPDKHAEVRGEILTHLIDSVLLDQFLKTQQVQVDPKEVQAKIDEMKAELKKQNMDFAKFLEEMLLTEAELREVLTSDLRWQKYAAAQASDKVVFDLFNASKEMFDGTQVRARHILITPTGTDARAVEAAQVQLATLKKTIEQQAAAEVAKLPPATDALSKEKVRAKTVEDAFAAVAREKSACPSKDQGGEVGWFHRVGVMVEPFARAAFALKPYEMSEPVATPFGCHLILAVERKPGREVKFEDIKEDVKEVYCERLRQSVVAGLKPTAKVVVNK